MKSIQVIFGLMLCLSVAFGTPTTHVWGPSTDVQPYGKLHITDDVYLPTEPGPAPITNIGLTMGVLPFKTVNLEVGFDHKAGQGLIDRYPMYYNAKLGIPEGSFNEYMPAAAVGIYDMGTKAYEKENGFGTDFSITYAKLAKTFGPAGRLSVGFFSGNEDMLLDSKGEKDNSGLMAAWEKTVSEVSDKLWVCLEYLGTESGYGTMNIGAAWKFADNIALLAGYDIFNNSDLVDTATLQLDIDLTIIK